jgi:hypothetical protein
MLKLYRFSDSQKEYWEAWEAPSGDLIVHWGVLGTRGDSMRLRPEADNTRNSPFQIELEARLKDGFAPIDVDDHAILLIEYALGDGDTRFAVEKRHRLEDRMNETLGWTGLGACDGGSFGNGTIEVCNFVVDFEIAKKVIEDDLVGTEFADYARIFGGRFE